jgi:signal transduction histidine kinase
MAATVQADADFISLNKKGLRYLQREESYSDFGKMFTLANNFYSRSEILLLRKTTDIIIQRATVARDSSNLARGNLYMAELYKLTGHNDSSYICYLKAEKLYRKLQDFRNLSDVLVRKGDAQSNQNDFIGSERSASEALTILRNYSDTFKSYQAYNLIGISSFELGNYAKAIEYYQRALKEAENLTDANKIFYTAIALNNIGNAYEHLRNYRQAIEYFQRALQLSGIQDSYPDFYATLIDNMAYSKFRLGENRELPGLFFDALAIRNKFDEKSKVVLSHIHLSEYYFNKLDTAAAIDHALKGLSVARKDNLPTDVLSAYKQIASVDVQNAAYYTNQYIRLSDSIQKIERSNKDRFARIEFETDEIALRNDKLAAQNRNLLYFFVGFLLIGVLLFVIRSQRARNRELLLIQAQQKANEDIYNLMISQQNIIEESRIKEKKRIAQELHDGVLGRLFGTRLNLDSLNRMVDFEAVARRTEYLNELKNIEQDIREISHDLNREKYALINNFLAILNNLLEEQKTSFNTTVEFKIDDQVNWDSLNNTIKINIYRIVQESLQNVNKYAQATKVKIQILQEENYLTLTIADNGIGFDTNLKKKGIGVQNMLSRAREMNGEFDIQSKRGKGTTIIVKIPKGAIATM